MRQVKLFAAAILAVIMATFLFVACSKPISAEPLNAEIVADYTKTAEERAETFASGSMGYSWENGEPFNVWWNPQNVSYEENKLSLYISEMTEKETTWDEETQTNVPCKSEYYGAEVRSKHFYGYGDYQVRMKPAKIAGTASTFFVCTGPYDKWYDENGNVIKENHHDEIDIEFLGKDTTKVQFNYFANGKGGHEYMYDLGFDASEEYHDYGFRWAEDSITWFVDEKPVYQVLRSKIRSGESWPEEPGRLVMNYWCGTEGAEAWMGKFNDDYSGHADYEWIKCSAEAQLDPNTTKPHHKPDPDPKPNPDELVVPTEGWAAIDYTAFDGWGMYTVDKTNGISVSHTEDVSGYKCCGMPLANSYSWVKFHIKNNATEAAVLRIDLKKEGGDNGVSAVKINDIVTLNPLESAINLTLAAGEEADVVAQIKEMTIDQMVIFLNSTGADMPTSGDIIITDLQGISTGGKPIEPDPQPVDGFAVMNLALATWNNNYTVTNEGGKSVISHTKEVVDRYVNANMGVNFTEANNTVKLVIKNNGTEPAFVKVGIQENVNYNCVLSSASLNGVALEASAYEYGATATIAAGEEATFIIVADLARNPATLFVALNSENELGTNAATGNITVNAYTKVPTQEDGFVAMNLALVTWNDNYTIVNAIEKSVISHTQEIRDRYVNGNMDVNLTEANNTIKLVIKNNGTEAAFVKVGVQDENYNCVLSAASLNGVELDASAYQYGATATIAAGEEVTFIITVDLSKNPVKLFVALNSENELGTNAATGNITVKAYHKVASQEE